MQMNQALAAKTKSATGTLDQSVKGHGAQALVVQGYALSALQQPHVDFAGFDRLKDLETSINGGIDRAKYHSNRYLDVVLPEMIKQIGNIDAYFNLQDAIPKALDTSSDAKTAIRFMKIAQERSQQYQSDASGLVKQLQSLRGDFSDDAGNFKTWTTNLNAVVNGDNGVLDSINKQLGSIDGKIAGAITGTVVSGLAIAGGAMLIAVGGIADFVTAGTTTPLVVAGVAVVAAGVGGEVASAVTLAKLIDLKGDLLSKKAKLKAEVSLASGIATGFDSLAQQAAGAATATQAMANAWSGLDDHLGNLITSLESGQTTADDVRLLFQTAAQGDVRDIRRDVGTIRGQLAGAETVIDPKTPVAKLVVDNARRRAAA